MSFSHDFESLPNWALNVLNVYNPSELTVYKYWFDFLKNNLIDLDGDVVEIGVFKGRSLCTTAHFLKKYCPGKLVWGYDSFSGFPSDSITPRDDISEFDRLFNSGSISSRHFELVSLNKVLLSAVSSSLNTDSISSSGNFSSTSLSLVESKLSFLGLDNYKLIDGDVNSTILDPDCIPSSVSAIFLDCDLYLPYKNTLNSLWPRLSKGGLVFLDEYFSLKFPGPRQAVDTFISATDDAELTCIERSVDGFERWVIIKL